MQTLCAGCSKAEPESFAPPQTSFPGARNGQNLISWRRSLLSPTDPVWWRSMHAISSYRGNRATNKHINRQGQLQYTAPQLSAQCNNNSTVGCILCQCQWSHKNCYCYTNDRQKVPRVVRYHSAPTNSNPNVIQKSIVFFHNPQPTSNFVKLIK